MANTTHRTIRCPDSIWNPAKERAKAEGTDMTAVLQDFLKRYGEHLDRPEL